MNIFLLISTLYTMVNSLPSDYQVISTPHIPSTFVRAPFNNLREITHKKIADTVKSKSIYIVPPFPDSGRTKAALEHEYGVSKIDSTYGKLQNFVAGFYNPKPVVDTIQEHEKYGNDGEKTRNAATFVIAGVEGISNLINAVIDIPNETIAQVGRKVSENLAAVGAKAVGL